AAAAAALHLAHEEEQQADEQDEREPVEQNVHQARTGLRRIARHLDAAATAQQVVHQFLVATGCVHAIARAVRTRDLQREFTPADVHLAVSIAAHPLDE